ncbi:NRDE-2, necessary for RNA interference-domain-containing protein [Cladochytrium replicatum]|nr:NRDE-2, necessary for RNA interference-domain-containing protein [Cladochytrium replicatum]
MNFPSFATFAEPKKTDGEHSKKRGEERKEKDRSHSETSKHVNENESKDIKDKKRKRESRDKERKKKNRKSRKNEDDIQDQLRKELALPDENKLFVVDRRGDLKNVVYDSLTSASVPMYRRGTNKILGMEGYILSNAANQKFAEGGLKMMELNGPYIADSPRSKYLEWKRTLRQKPTNIKDIAQRPERNKPNRSTLTGKKEDQAEYIQLESESDSEIGEPGLYKIDDNAKNPAATSVDEEYFKRTKEVNIKLDKDQNNVQLWMEYIAIQDLLLPKSKRLQKNRAAQSIAVESKKLGIYEKALKQIPNDETLLIGYIESYGVVHGSANILNKWAYVLRSKQKSISLWSRYLNFRQTEVGSFTVSGCVEAYSKCITALAPWKESPDDTVQIFEEHMLHMFNRCCTLLEQTGYNERAVSLYQAMIELTCFCPAAYTHQSFKQRVDMLESFWESEAPRIGEEGALGWSNSLLRENADVSDEQSETDDVDFQDIFEWAKAEINHEHVHWIPSKSVADTSDPFRTVLFDDLRPLLFEIRTPSVKVSLIYHFISYLRIPINEGVSTNSWRFNDPFSRLPGWCSGADSAGILSRSQIKQFFGIDVPQNDRLGFGVRNVPGSLHIVQPEGNKSRWSILRREDVEAAEKSGAGKPEFAQ